MQHTDIAGTLIGRTKLFFTARQIQGVSTGGHRELRSMQERWWEQKAEEMQFNTDTNKSKTLYSAINAIYDKMLYSAIKAIYDKMLYSAINAIYDKMMYSAINAMPSMTRCCTALSVPSMTR